LTEGKIAPVELLPQEAKWIIPSEKGIKEIAHVIFIYK